MISSTLDQCLGCIYGAFIGDAVGAYVEGRRGTIDALEVRRALAVVGGGVHSVAPGQITDDSELALALSHALIAASLSHKTEMDERKSNSEVTQDNCDSNLKLEATNPVALIFPLHHIAREYSRWFRSKPFDVGNTCKRAFEATTRYALSSPNQPPKKLWADCMRTRSQRENIDSKSNGSLMRCTPLAVWGHRLSVDQLGYCAEQDSLLTHPNPSSCEAEACYVISCAHLIRHEKDVEGAFSAAWEWLLRTHPNSEVLGWLEEAKLGILPSCLQNIGYAKIGFVHAYFHLLNKSDYLIALETVIRGGGDTDTNAAIVGGLLGAYYGFETLPSTLVDALQNCDTSLGRPRPVEYTTRGQIRRIVEALHEFAPESIKEFGWVVGQPLPS